MMNNTNARPNRKPQDGSEKRFKPHNRGPAKKKINKKIEKTHMHIDFKDINLLQKFMINGYISFTKKKKFTKSTVSSVSRAIKRARYLGLISY